MWFNPRSASASASVASILLGYSQNQVSETFTSSESFTLNPAVQSSYFGLFNL